MPRPEAKLSYVEVDALLEWIAAHGGTYRQYLLFCEKYNIGPDRRYTERTYDNWQQRHRDRLRQKREEHKVALREGSILDRRHRIQMLENDVSRLEQALARDEMMDPLQAAKLMEQKRKLLESISRERGEWGERPKDPEEVERAANNKYLAEVFGKAFSGDKP